MKMKEFGLRGGVHPWRTLGSSTAIPQKIRRLEYQRVPSTPCRRSTQFWLLRKWNYNGDLWENILVLWTEIFDWTLKYLFTDNHEKSTCGQVKISLPARCTNPLMCQQFWQDTQWIFLASRTVELNRVWGRGREHLLEGNLQLYQARCVIVTLIVIFIQQR